MSEVLRRELIAFQAWFEEGADEDDGTRYPDELEAAGRKLLERVRAELRSPWRITRQL